jgi:pimeloyl-ACP methyl ester carboxylesterase
VKANHSTGLLGALVLVAALTLTGAAEGRGALRIERRVFPVTLSDGNTYSLVGYLYYQGSLRNRPVQVLTHGISYNHTYWDVPSINGLQYSYVEYMAHQQYAVLALDMLGTGESDRPEGDLFNLANSVSALHQVTQQLRAQAADGMFEKIVYVGHSNGALISTVTQALYRDADALVLTGWMNSYRVVALDPKLVEALLANPYIHVPTEVRTAFFYDPASSDPDVVAYDNANLADTLTRGQFLDLLRAMSDPAYIPTAQVTGPVLVQMGENDPVAPAALADQEAASYPNARVTVEKLRAIGHCFNTHYRHYEGWAQIDAWIRRELRRR